MAAVDFTGWVQPDLVLTLGGGTYHVPPPSVDRAKAIVALAVRAEINLGLYRGEVPQELQGVLDSLTKDRALGQITLGDKAYQQMLDDKVPVPTVERMAYYAMLFWARGKGRADQIAEALWSPANDAQAQAEAGAAPGEAPGR